MATKIVTKNSSTAGAAPTATDLVQGELAVNVADGRLYTENASAAIVELGVNPAAEIQANAGVAFPDNQKATFGTGGDLEIYHDGGHSRIADVGTGILSIRASDTLYLQSATNENYLKGVADGDVSLYYNNVAKIATTSTGIDVTGTASATSVTSAQHLTAGSAYSVLFGDGGERISGNNSSSLLNFFTGAAERMRIDSSGIDVTGTVVADGLTVATGGDGVKATIGKTGGTNLNIYADANTVYLAGSSSLSTAYIIDQTNNTMQFKVNAAERMRIDSSGNLLVGKSAASFGTAGVAVFGSGEIDITNTNEAPLFLNRLGSDGVIQYFYKNGTAVGSIGTVANRLAIGSGDVGIFFDDLNDRWVPITQTGLADRDAAIDLGYSSSRFKDLYLSGGVYLGGTGAANKLDDYEEGTWTPTSGVSLTQNTTATYTKIGRLVHINFDISIASTSSGSDFVMSMPFAGITSFYAGGVINYTTATSVGCINLDGTDIKIRNEYFGSNKLYADMSGHRLIASVTYRTNA